MEGMKSWAMEVIADSSGKFCGNACRYATREEAEQAGRDLMGRWILVREWRAVESVDPVNYKFENGRNVMLPEGVASGN